MIRVRPVIPPVIRGRENGGATRLSTRPSSPPNRPPAPRHGNSAAHKTQHLCRRPKLNLTKTECGRFVVELSTTPSRLIQKFQLHVTWAAQEVLSEVIRFLSPRNIFAPIV